jgi:hypothetical protein
MVSKNALFIIVAIVCFVAGAGRGEFPNNGWDLLGFVLLGAALLGYLGDHQAKKNRNKGES